FRWLPPRATHSQQLRAGWALRASGSWIPEIPLELVRSDEITGNSRRCKKNFEKFCKDHDVGAGVLAPCPFVSCSHSLWVTTVGRREITTTPHGRGRPRIKRANRLKILEQLSPLLFE